MHYGLIITQFSATPAQKTIWWVGVCPGVYFCWVPSQLSSSFEKHQLVQDRRLLPSRPGQFPKHQWLMGGRDGGEEASLFSFSDSSHIHSHTLFSHRHWGPGKTAKSAMKLHHRLPYPICHSGGPLPRPRYLLPSTLHPSTSYYKTFWALLVMAKYKRRIATRSVFSPEMYFH